MKKIIISCVLLTTLTACNNPAKHDEEIRVAKQKVLDSITTAENIKKKILDSIKIADSERQRQEKVVTSNETQTTSPKKKGWSNKAKGAVIGAGVGAATGAIVSKNKGQGAIIGGIVGAAAGFGTGAILDDKKKKN